MRRTTRVAIATLVAGGLAIGLSVGVAGPSLANTSDANLRQDDMRGLEVVDDDGDDRDPRGRDMTWTDNTRPSLTKTISRTGLTRPGDTDVTRDWTRSVDFTRDLTNTNTVTSTNTVINTNTRGR